MKLIYVSSDDDYGVESFEDSKFGKMSLQEVYDFVKNEHNGEYIHFDTEQDCEVFAIAACEFKGVTLTDEFINFLNDKKDYDDTKNSDWFVVTKG